MNKRVTENSMLKFLIVSSVSSDSIIIYDFYEKDCYQNGIRKLMIWIMTMDNLYFERFKEGLHDMLLTDTTTPHRLVA
jgi:hypothetical protein